MRNGASRPPCRQARSITLVFAPDSPSLDRLLLDYLIQLKSGRS